uniref:Putative enoyl-CoA hydratase (PaaF, echA) n=1 Tax=uncultured marine thaumarchaeote KM3_55_F05 TaxID=1456198 RepID=A0A075HEQ2_9ARCH|nr:putative enoyl-CoA hydratase (paaF, echA) [uncultured marine thaumarchaeote KM3_55_F05]
MSGKVTEHMDGHISIITLNRPDRLNVLDIELMNELVSTLEMIEQNNSIRVIVLTGGDRVFSAGADLAGMMKNGRITIPKKSYLHLWDRVAQIKKPIIAAVTGHVLGGGLELAMACDMIVASETAKLGHPEIKVGLIPGAGGTQRLTRIIGKYRTMEMILTGDSISAKEAQIIGLVNRVTSHNACLEEAIALAKVISERPPIAVQRAKEAVLEAEEQHLSTGIQHERKSFLQLFATEDTREGIRAFLRKRHPRFVGR